MPESTSTVTGIVIAPQRQTALLAKQAAEIDVLTGGNFRLGVGLGWNAVEYEALGMNFHDRGRRLEEQIELMRRLWTEPVVTFEGRWSGGRVPLSVLPMTKAFQLSPEDTRLLDAAEELAGGETPGGLMLSLAELTRLLNALTGNLDAPGGAMFPNPAFDVGAFLKAARLLGYGDHGRHRWGRG